MLIKVDNQLLRAGYQSWFNVDQEHRVAGPAIALQRAVLKTVGSEFAFFYARPSDTAEAVFRRVGYVPIGRSARYVKVLQLEPYFRRQAALNRWARFAARPAEWLWQAVSADTWSCRSAPALCDLEQFDHRFDELWERASSHYRAALERRSTFLSWRYHQSPDQEFRILGQFEPDSLKLSGYVVYYLDGAHVRVVDLFALNTGRPLDELVCALIRWARARKATSLVMEACGPEHLERTLRRYGFYLRPGSEANLLVAGIAQERDRLVENLSSWYLSAADTARD
jgi:hypothetical protein